MALNSKGKFFPNFQLARASEAMGSRDAKSNPAPDDQPEQDSPLPAKKVEVHKHPDQTFHTITTHDDGTRSKEEHPDLESVKSHLDATMKPQDDDVEFEDSGDHEYR